MVRELPEIVNHEGNAIPGLTREGATAWRWGPPWDEAEEELQQDYGANEREHGVAVEEDHDSTSSSSSRTTPDDRGGGGDEDVVVHREKNSPHRKTSTWYDYGVTRVKTNTLFEWGVLTQRVSVTSGQGFP